MGSKLSEIREQERVILHIYNDDKQMNLEAVILKHLKENLAVIGLNYSGTKQLVFDKINVDLEYYPADGVPTIWRNVKIVFYQNAYILQAVSDGVRNNRRNSFRVSVAKKAWCKMTGHDSCHVLIKDISLSGFSITDQKKELNLAMNEQVSISFEDWGHEIKLDGRLVRIEERENMIIYGFAICNMCRDLSSYVNLKQRRNRKKV